MRTQRNQRACILTDIDRAPTRARKVFTPSSMSLQIRETVERLIPDSLPRALTRSSTLRVETPSLDPG